MDPPGGFACMDDSIETYPFSIQLRPALITLPGNRRRTRIAGVAVADDQAKLVKERNDIVDLIGEYVNLTRAGRVYKGLCPFHDDHRPSFQVDPGKQSWVCWPCNLRGDVYDFIMKRERIEFREALEFLARRANIELSRLPRSGPSKQDQHDLLTWVANKYHKALFLPENKKALEYIAEERQIAPETLERYQIGYAPCSWEWLSNQVSREGKSSSLLTTLKVCGLRKDGSLFDHFRDRIIFPIRDVQGRVVAFGGRLLPGSPKSEDQAKYYNSADSSLFKKSQHLYGLDIARVAAERTGYLAVVEGYTDVLMAHQHGVLHVVATLGTALNENHIAQLKRFVSRVVLLFDADAGGAGGVERALSLFVQSEMDLAIASLPDGLDPCDFLIRQGAGPFVEILDRAQDALEFTLAAAFASGGNGIESQRRAMERVLGVLAGLPVNVGGNLAVKRDLMLSRLAQRCGVNEATLRKRLGELQRQQPAKSNDGSSFKAPGSSKLDAGEDRLERELIQVLIVQPKLIPQAREHIQPEMLTHANRRRVLAELYDAAEENQVNIDNLRERLADEPKLVQIVSQLHAEGVEKANPQEWFIQVKEAYLRQHRQKEIERITVEIKRWDAPEPPAQLLGRLQELRTEQKQASDVKETLRN
jgi:DNA primase